MRPDPTDYPTATVACGPTLWFRADYLLWFAKKSPLPTPLIATGTPLATADGVALTAPAALAGAGSNKYPVFSGFRLSGGYYFDPAGQTGIDASGFILGRTSKSSYFGSDPAGNPAIGQPIIVPPAGRPGRPADGVRVPAGGHGARLRRLGRDRRPGDGASAFGYEVNASRLVSATRTSRLEAALGFTQFGVREELYVRSDITDIGGGGLTFLGTPTAAGDRVITEDRFRASTDFYGPQASLRWTGNYGRFGVSAAGRLGLGVSEMVYQLTGASTVVPASGAAAGTTPGGLYVLDSNAGRYYRSAFGVLVGGDLSVSYAVTNWLGVRAGYSFTYLNRAARPGLVLTNAIDPTRLPTDPTFGAPHLTNQPTFSFRDQGFWVQGVTLGVSVQY